MRRDRQNGQAWADFFEAHHAAITAYAVALTGNLSDAQDLVQDVLLAMVRTRRGVQDAKAYFMRSLRNAAIDRARSRAARDDADAWQGLDVAFIDAPVDDIQRRELAERIGEALSRVASARREVIVLKTYAGMTFKEIAETLDLPMGTVASHYTRGLTELRAAFEKESARHVAG